MESPILGSTDLSTESSPGTDWSADLQVAPQPCSLLWGCILQTLSSARSKCASETLWSKVLQSWVPTAGWVLSPSGVQPILTQAAICLQVLGTPCVLLMSHCFYYYTFYLCACLSVCGCDHVSTGVPGGQRHRVPPEAAGTGSCEPPSRMLSCKTSTCS